MKSDVIVAYNEYYDNVPLGYYRYLFEALKTKYDYIKIKGFYDIKLPSHKVVVNLTPFANNCLKSEGVKIIQFLDDMHSHNGDYSGFKHILDNSTIVFGTETESPSVKVNPFWQENASKLKWLPHFAYPYEVTIDNWANRPIEYINSGHYNEKDYPFRHKYTNVFKPSQAGHPGYDPKMVETTRINGYFYKMLSRGKFCAACGGTQGYVVSKYFEVPYCGSILIGQANPLLEGLGFVHKNNCLIFTNEELTTAPEVINNLRTDELTKISLAGASLIRDKHMLKHRIQQIDDTIKELLGGDV